jgi:putative membrane protein
MWSNYGYQPGMMGYGDGWYWWMGLHGLMSVLFIALIVIAVIAAIRYLARGDRQPTQAGAGEEGGRQSALGILDARYARGEIDRDEYLQKKKDLA